MAQANPIRTADELRDPLFNYFIAFKINIKETDKTKIEPQIKKILSDPKGSVQSRRLLELKNDILEIMCNDSVFDAQANCYKQNAGGRAKEAKAAQQLKLKETLDIVQILCTTRSTLLKSEIKKIYDSANTPVTFFTEEEFNNAIKPLLSVGVKIIDNLDTSIPFDKYQKTEQYLKPLDKKDLYEFLGCKITDSTKDIEEKSNEQYKNSQKISDLKKKQAIGSLCGVVKELLLSSPASRKSYDNYLALKDEVWSDFDKRKTFGIKELKTDEYETYAQKIINTLHISAQEAEKMLAVACKYFQFTVIGVDNGKGSHFEICPHPDCGLLYTKGAKSCPHCGKPLEVICWNCSQKTPLTKDDKGCPSCGATYHSHDVFTAKCGQLDALLAKPDVGIPELQTALLELKNIVPNYASKTDSTLYKKVREFEGLIEKKKKQEETTGAAYRAELTKVREFIAKKEYQTAYGIAKSLQTKYGNYNIETSKKVITEIMTVLNAAQRQIEAAKNYAAQNNENLAVTTAMKVLESCADYSEARQIMQKFPPKPVMNLKVSLNGGKVRLEWEDKVKQDYVTYTIIKKVGVAPVNTEDGALVDKGLTIKFFEDSNIVSATPYYYSVFTERYGIASNLCTSISPVMGYADVINVQQEFVTNGIKVSYETPQNLKSVEVWKKEGPVAPLQEGDGTKINCDGKGFYDEKCTGENAYLILCNYQVKDRVIKSKGIKVVYKPYEKTSPLEDVAIEPIGPNKYSFSCKEGYAGNVSLYYSETKLPIQTNTVLKYIDFNTVCKGLRKLETSLTLDGKVSFMIEPNKIGQVYAIVATEQLFVVSPPKIVNTILGMNLSHKVNGGVLSISGTVHPKASGIVVKVSHDKYPETITDGGENFSFKKDEFVRQGKIDLNLKSNTLNYVTVFGEFVIDGIKTYSQPEKLNPPIDYRESVTVLYVLDYNPSGIKPFKVTINFECDREAEIPALLLMKGHPRPMNKTAGELCERTDPLKLKKGFFSKKYTGKIVITASPTATNTKFAVFTSDDSTLVSLKEVRKL